MQINKWEGSQQAVICNLLYKSGYILTAIPSGELSPKDLKFLSFQVYLPLHISFPWLWWTGSLILMSGFMNYAPEPRKFSSTSPILYFVSLAQWASAANKDPAENEDKMCPWDGRTSGHPHPGHRPLPAESPSVRICQHVLESPSVDLSVHESPTGPPTDSVPEVGNTSSGSLVTHSVNGLSGNGPWGDMLKIWL